MASGSFNSAGWGNYTKKYQLIVEWSSAANIPANNSTVTATIKLYTPYRLNISARYSNKVTINGEVLYYDSPAVYTDRETYTTIGTVKSSPIGHNADGTKSIAIAAEFRFNASLDGGYYGTQTASATVSLDNIPRAATLTAAPNFTDEENPTIAYSNPAGEAVTTLKACISFDGALDDIPFRDVPKTGTGYTFRLTDAERNKIKNRLINTNSLSVVFSLATLIGGEWKYSKLYRTVRVVNADPVASPSMYDNDSSIVALTGDSNKVVIGYSNIYFNIGAAAKKGATIKSYRVYGNGLNTQYTQYGTFTNSPTNQIFYEVIDSRGNAVRGSRTLTAINYTELSSNLTAELSAIGELSLSFSGNYFNASFGAVQNTLTLEYRYKASGGNYSEWINVSPQIVGNTYTAAATVAGLGYKNSYIIQARATDKLKSVLSAEVTVLSYPLFDWGANDFNFNVPITFNGVPMNDFIVEQGTENNWFYRKWNSGIAECWRLYYGAVNASQTNYNGYYYSPTITVPYPFTFTNLPCLQANGGSTANMNFVRVFGQYEDAATFCVCGHAADATNTNIIVNLYAIGRWK